MEVALENTTAYLKSRKQFGVTLNTFQALNFRSADMYVSLELARSLAMWASMVLAEGSGEEAADRGGPRLARRQPRRPAHRPGGDPAARRHRHDGGVQHRHLHQPADRARPPARRRQPPPGAAGRRASAGTTRSTRCPDQRVIHRSTNGGVPGPLVRGCCCSWTSIRSTTRPSAPRSPTCAAAADRLRADRDRVARQVDALLDGGWSGPAATAYAEGWADWCAGAERVLDGLVTMGRLLDAVHLDLTERDLGSQSDLEPARRRGWADGRVLGFGVDLDLLDDTVAEMARCGEALDALLDEVARRVAALHVTWAGRGGRRPGRRAGRVGGRASAQMRDGAGVDADRRPGRPTATTATRPRPTCGCGSRSDEARRSASRATPPRSSRSSAATSSPRRPRPGSPAGCAGTPGWPATTRPRPTSRRRTTRPRRRRSRRWSRLVGAFGALGRLVEASLANHAHADARSTLPGWARAVAGPPTVADRAVGVLLAAPPSSLGADAGGPGGPAGWCSTCCRTSSGPTPTPTGCAPPPRPGPPRPSLGRPARRPLRLRARRPRGRTLPRDPGRRRRDPRRPRPGRRPVRPARRPRRRLPRLRRPRRRQARRAARRCSRTWSWSSASAPILAGGLSFLSGGAAAGAAGSAGAARLAAAGSKARGHPRQPAGARPAAPPSACGRSPSPPARSACTTERINGARVMLTEASRAAVLHQRSPAGLPGAKHSGSHTLDEHVGAARCCAHVADRGSQASVRRRRFVGSEARPEGITFGPRSRHSEACSVEAWIGGSGHGCRSGWRRWRSRQPVGRWTCMATDDVATCTVCEPS